jgi:hypothetical protein
MRNNKRLKNTKPLISRKIKTYKPEEILAAGGAKAFSEQTRSSYNTETALQALSDIALSDMEIE